MVVLSNRLQIFFMYVPYSMRISAVAHVFDNVSRSINLKSEVPCARLSNSRFRGLSYLHAIMSP